MPKVTSVYLCPIPDCPRVFTNGAGLKQHITRCHTYLNHCPICGEETSALKKHLLRSADPLHIILYTTLPNRSADARLKIRMHRLISFLKVEGVAPNTFRGDRLTLDREAKDKLLDQVSNKVEAMKPKNLTVKFGDLPARQIIMKVPLGVRL